jgi:FAD/FMN-containing dehydrogenase
MLLGGFGFLSRLHGLSIDNLVEAEVVLADGQIIIVNEKEYPGALRPIIRRRRRAATD